MTKPGKKKQITFCGCDDPVKLGPYNFANRYGGYCPGDTEFCYACSYFPWAFPTEAKRLAYKRALSRRKKMVDSGEEL